MSDDFFKTHPAYRRAQPGLQRWSVFCWMTALSGTAWLRDPNVRAPWRLKLEAGLWGWAFIGLFPLLVLWLGVWIIWLFVRICLLGFAAIFTAAYWLARLTGANRRA
ncbi:MAG TPA: hypothetical protein VFA37_08355 [Gaiellaceae bacterium]|nr:hypothetical protein [Gaiellaceae bacterium]